MLRINRSAERADAFHKFVKRKNLKTWSDFNGFPAEKVALREELSRDQNYLDGYTEQSLYKTGNGDVNIEHFRCWAKFNWPQECYNYYNYVIANKNRNFGGDYKDIHIQKADYDIIFNPIEEDMSLYVEYDLGSGKITARKGLDESIRRRVLKTIEVFNLFHDTLNASRLSLINEIIDSLTPEIVSQFEKDEIKSWFADRPYPTMVEWVIDTYFDSNY